MPLKSAIKILSIVFAISVLHTSLVAQVRISGTVTDQDHQPLAGVSITIFKTNESKIIRFAITDAQGKFIVEAPLHSDTLYISASMLGYDKKIVSFFPGKEISFSFSLTNKPVILKEVTVEKPPVWKRKDTINYDAATFQQPQDRVIGDVIARLPGIEVSSTGQIKYNGKPINKFYIEGLDLLEDRYGIATNNIPATSVDKIQVLENHQPIKLLDSISFSNRAALNIKLKDNAKTKLVGRGKLGMGASPLLSEDELVAMLFKKRGQFLNTYKYNNTGIDNAKEISAQNIGEYLEAMENGAIKSDLVAVVQPAAPSIAETRDLFNNAHTLSVNQLIPVSPQYQARLNASYVNDYRQQQSNATTRIYLPSDTISINEQNNFFGNYNNLQGDLSLMANTSNYYCKNTLKFLGWWSAERNNLFTKNEISQHLSNPFYNVSNDLKLLWSKQKHIIHFNSYTGFVSMPQQLEIVPGLYSTILNENVAYDKLIQKASLKVFYTDNFLGFATRLSRFTVDHKIGFNIQSQQYDTYLITELSGVKKNPADSFQNNLEWKRSRLYFENSFSYDDNKLKIKLTVPLTLAHFKVTDPDLDENFFIINPNVNFTYSLNSEWMLNGNFNYGNDFGDYSNVARGFVLKNYRHLGNNNAPIAQNRSTSISTTVTFRNPIKIKFFHTGVRLSWKQSNLLYSQQYNGSLETLIALLQDNNTSNFNFFGRYSKYFLPWKSSIGINYSYTIGKRELLQQQVLSLLSNQSFSAGMDIKTKISKNISTDYKAGYFDYRSKKPRNSLKTFNQNINLNYFPGDRLIFRATMEHYYFPHWHYYFADLSLRYTTKKSAIDYELSCQNIFNTKVFISGFLSENIETVTEYQLRPRQFLLKANFSF